jgi:hypothetical protein
MLESGNKSPCGICKGICRFGSAFCNDESGLELEMTAWPEGLLLPVKGDNMVCPEFGPAAVPENWESIASVEVPSDSNPCPVKTTSTGEKVAARAACAAGTALRGGFGALFLALAKAEPGTKAKNRKKPAANRLAAENIFFPAMMRVEAIVL